MTILTIVCHLQCKRKNPLDHSDPCINCVKQKRQDFCALAWFIDKFKGNPSTCREFAYLVCDFESFFPKPLAALAVRLFIRAN